jgi:hypothetical protein
LKSKAAKDAGANNSHLSFAGLVLDYSPDLVADVLAGRMGLQTAADVAREKKRQQTERERRERRVFRDLPM